MSCALREAIQEGADKFKDPDYIGISESNLYCPNCLHLVRFRLWRDNSGGDVYLKSDACQGENPNPIKLNTSGKSEEIPWHPRIASVGWVRIFCEYLPIWNNEDKAENPKRLNAYQKQLLEENICWTEHNMGKAHGKKG